MVRNAVKMFEPEHILDAAVDVLSFRPPTIGIMCEDGQHAQVLGARGIKTIEVEYPEGLEKGAKQVVFIRAQTW